MAVVGRMWWQLVRALAVVMGLLVGGGAAADEFLDPELAFGFSAAMATPERVDLHFKVAPEYYMYRERFDFQLAPGDEAQRLGEPVLPPGLMIYDPTFDADMEVFYGQYTVQVPVTAGASQPLVLTVVSQGCAEAGLCYVPTEHVLTLSPVEGGYALTGDGAVARVPDISESTPPQQYEVGSEVRRADASSASAGPVDVADAAPGAAAPGSMQSAPAAQASAAAGTSLGQALSLGDRGLADYLMQAGLGQIVLLAVLLGLLLSFTPCVLPMVPILLAILAGDQQAKTSQSRWRGLALSATFVLGMSLVYTILGVAAGLVGASLAAWLQTPWVLAVFASLLALFALAMFDVFTLQAPVGMQSALNERINRLPGGRYGGVFLMGMVSALIVGPCVAAPLAGVLLFISQTGDVVLGGTALFSMAWGEGLLLLAVGASSGALLPRAGAWMNGIKRLFGILLFATAWWMVNSILPSWLIVLGWVLLAMWSAVMLGALRGLPADAGAGAMFNKAVGVLLAVWAVLLLAGLAMGERDLLQPLRPLAIGVGTSTQMSASAGPAAAAPTFMKVDTVDELDAALASTEQPVMLDFYADWCVSCIEMERFTFTDPGVASRMGQFLLLQADVTGNRPGHRELLRRFQLFGPPGILFFDGAGRELEQPRVIGFQNAERFSASLDEALQQTQ